jgi:uncharacterized zinc-type alcohol dehydrogenase-like protein
LSMIAAYWTTVKLKLGAHHMINSRDSSKIEAASGQFDYIIAIVNVKLDWNTYINVLRPKGRLHFVGLLIIKQQFVKM